MQILMMYYPSRSNTSIYMRNAGDSCLNLSQSTSVHTDTPVVLTAQMIQATIGAIYPYACTVFASTSAENRKLIEKLDQECALYIARLRPTRSRA